MIFTQAISVVKPARRASVYSSETVDDWDNATETPVSFRVSIQPAASTEGPAERPQIVDTWRLFTPPHTDIPGLTAGDRIKAGRLVLELVGDPLRWPDPLVAGRVHHIEATLRGIRG